MMTSTGIKSTPITLFHAKRNLSPGFEFITGQPGSTPMRISAKLGNRTKQANKSWDLMANWKPYRNDFCGHGRRLNCLSASRELTALIIVHSSLANTVRDSQLCSESSRSEGSSLAKVLFNSTGFKRKHSVSYKAIAASFASAGRLKHPDQEITSSLHPQKYSQKRDVTTTVAATADSGQTFPSQNEGEEKAVDCARGGEREIPRKPSPEIEPAEVVRAQLQALHENDITTVFEFASPKNKAHTGPLSKFTEMIQGRAYNVMLGHASADILSSLSICPERFQQRILIKGANGNQAIFSWSLSRQENGPFQGCWMTDSVHRDE